MENSTSHNFLEQIIEDDLKNGFPKEKLRFRFPPEPNGYLHIGHVKAININFGLAKKYNAPINLRFDDTNPANEEIEYINGIKEDIEWLGFSWDKVCYASDYFNQLYNWALILIQNGKAYVDSQSYETININRKTPLEKGIESPYRNRDIEENLKLFKQMKGGVFEEGSHVLRAKIDMSSPNMHLRDPVMYRILKKSHHRTKNDWCIYPTYDWAHGQSDFIEQISHSLCSLEFIHHRPLYNWFLEEIYEPNKIKNKQREFARGNVAYTITSKRKLQKLIKLGYVDGWDDPRMPTICGLRRRGYSPESLNTFWESVGVAKRDNIIDFSLLEFHVRSHLNKICDRLMVVMDPIKIVISNYPKDQEEWLYTENNPEKVDGKRRTIPFSRELFIERNDFKENANRKFFRLTIGKEVRLKSAYIIKGEFVKKDKNGNILEIVVTYDPKSKSGSGTIESRRKVKGTLHWVSCNHAIKIKSRIYDRLFTDSSPDGHIDIDFTNFINPNSLKEVIAMAEPSIKNREVGSQVQFQRIGYFCKDKDSDNLDVWNKTVGLKDSWAKIK